MKWKSLPPGLSVPHRVLVAKLRLLRECSERTQAAIASDANIAPTTLSNHLNGGRVPEESLLKSLFEVIEPEALAAGHTLPCTYEELRTLREHAAARHCPCCRHTVAASPTARSRPASSVTVAPASPTVRPRRIVRPRARVHVRPDASAVVPAALPVPLPEGDRQSTEQAGPAWTELETVLRYFATGRTRDAGVMLWRVGSTASPSEVVEAVASCRTAGKDAAAETVLSSASERADRQAVLNITAALHKAGQHMDVAYLLSAAAQD
ncbi:MULTISPECIES: helix-turn-helix domain-containing protein [unclassified Streptomyces]|uniref:helix-turn-helix domain-containing protein n=1 Tax=unclassified Streptomyces TaxID=2593676 RepID=UPI002E2EBAC1|nr:MULTISPECIES: helix-turn-helix transcriptional regulator [unclassified Streptomyces]WUC66303.1 helix-turn-helix domain-containing protein [Streptomyces sp. NBC_00539]